MVPEGWKKTNFKGCIEYIHSGKSVNSFEVPAESHEFGILKTSCVYSGQFNPFENKRVVDHEKKLLKCPAIAGNIIVSRMNTATLVGASGYIEIDWPNLFFPDRLWSITTKKNVLSRWLYYVISSPKNRKRLSDISSGTSASMKNISQESFLGIPLYLPPFKEQQKIAQILLTWDRAIATTEELLANSQQQKMAVMQQLLTGKRRFPGFSEIWEENALGNLTCIYDGTHLTPNYVDTGVPFYSVEHVTADDFTKTKFISKEVFERENKRVSLEKGDILMTKIGDIGTAKYIGWNVAASFYVSLALIKRSEKFVANIFLNLSEASFFNANCGDIRYMSHFQRKSIWVK